MRKRLDAKGKGRYPNSMDVLMARRLRLVLALLGATSLACSSSQDDSFSGGPGLSAGNGMSASGSTTQASTSEGSNASEGSNSASEGSDSATEGSDSNSNSASGTTTSTGPSTDTLGTGTSDDTTGTTGLDCEDGLGNLCGNPYDLGAVAEGDSAMSQTSTIITPGVADWFQVSFPAINRPGGGTPSINFFQNDDDAFRFDVYTQMPCGGTPASCGDGGEAGEATNLLEYTYTDDQPDCCAPPDDSMVPWPGQLFLRVYRIDEGQTCAAYQLALAR